MDKSFEPQSFETKWYAHWEAGGCFKPSGQGPAYTVLLPPPNVTGTLHMGHAFQHTLQDALVRYHRMRGYNTLWQMGTDHAGIATEMVVSRNLARENLTRDGLGRDKFIEKVWQWKRESGDTIERQMRRLGTSGDWTRSVFTMDPMPSTAVIEAFVNLHEQGLIYRGQRLVNWDPVLKTAISDLEVVSEEEDGFLWSIRYDVIDPQPGELDHVVVATTRPETMLGDAAVMVHPDDERYQTLIGKKVRLPLVGREIPVIADDYVDREFGTGVVKVTPAHDFNDYAVWGRHKDSALKDQPFGGLINIFCPDATIKNSPFDDFSFVSVKGVQLAEDNGLEGNAVSEIIPSCYHGLDRFEARKRILVDLTESGYLLEEKKHKLQVPRGDRTGQIIEPYLTNQWFVKMDALAARGLELVENGSVHFVPENWINTYRHWMGNIQDWCISRQLWWGHRIPAWYDDAGNIYVARSEEEAQEQARTKLKPVRGEPVEPPATVASPVHGSTSSPRTVNDGGKMHEGIEKIPLRRDNDVLETWFSSALWPFSTMGWPNPSAMAERGYEQRLPTSVLVTGFDIIFFWVARMIMMTDHFTGKVPFHEVYITGLVRDKDGQKMSKSKGNILDPIDIIDGITLDELVTKRTVGLMQPQMAAKIEKATRKEFPDGIPAFGADALRFTFASLATHGRDIKFDLNRAEGYKNFCNKLWNAARFVLMNCEGFSAPARFDAVVGAALAAIAANVAPTILIPKTDAERWILSRLARVTAEVETHLKAYRFDLASQALYEFTWNDYCDWFLELAKPALNGTDAEAANSTRHTLLHVLEATLRLLHPLIPFITEEIWQYLAPKLDITGDSISTQSYPEPKHSSGNYAEAEADIEWLKTIVSPLRRIRGEMNIAPSKLVPLLLQAGTSQDRERIPRFETALKFLARLESIAWFEGEPPACAAAVAGELKLLIPLAGLIDTDAEKKRLEKEIKRIEVEITKCQNKLGSETFVANAPAAVVAQERQRLSDWNGQLVVLQKQYHRL